MTLIPKANTDNPDRTADLIFIHGLNDSAEGCWKPKGWTEAEWWPNWVGKQFPELGVWLLDYPNAISNWQDDIAMTMENRATNLLEALKVSPLNRNPRPLIFIGHSMGGLFIKKLLHHAIETNYEPYITMMARTRAVIFLSTPHLGSHLAKLALNLEALKILKPSHAIKQLGESNPELKRLNDYYRNYFQKRGIDTKVFVEDRPFTIVKYLFVKLNITPVDNETGNPRLPEIPCIPLDEDHLSICKPKSKEALVCQSVNAFLEEVLGKLKAESQRITLPKLEKELAPPPVDAKADVTNAEVSNRAEKLAKARIEYLEWCLKDCHSVESIGTSVSSETLAVPLRDIYVSLRTEQESERKEQISHRAGNRARIDRHEVSIRQRRNSRCQ